MLLNYVFQDRASRFQDLLSHGLDEPASLEALGKLLLGRCEHAEAANYRQVFDYPRSYPVGAASHELVLKGHHLIADGGLAPALPATTDGRAPAPPRSSGCSNDESRCCTAPLHP